MIRYYCPVCDRVLERPYPRCPRCGSLLEVFLERRWVIDKTTPSIWRYRGLLPPVARTVSLYEGLTPLRRVSGVLVKDETRNPTRSYVDRGSSVLVSIGLAESASLGGSGSVCIEYEPDITLSFTAYTRALGLRTIVSLTRPPHGYAELAETVRLGADIVFTECGEKLHYDSPLVIEGLKTIAYELYEQRGHIECVAVPSEEGVLAFGVARGFQTLEDLGLLDKTPKVVAVVPGSRTWSRGLDLLRALGNIEVRVVDDRDIVDSLLVLGRRIRDPRPIAAAAYAYASRDKRCIALVTGSETKRGVAYRLGVSQRGNRLTDAQREVIDALRSIASERGVTAYTLWEYLRGRYTLRGVYTILETLVRKGLVRTEIELRGARRVALYSPVMSTEGRGLNRDNR